MHYFDIDCVSDHVCGASREWLEVTAYPQKIVCPNCHSVRPEVRRLDVTLESSIPKKATMAFIQGTHTTIVRADLVDLIELSAPNSIIPGDVRVESGSRRGAFKCVRDYRSILAVYPVFVRGAQNSSASTCPECGRLLFYAPFAHYLLRRDIKARVTQDQTTGLIADDALCQEVKKGPWKDLQFEKLDVLEEPLDGLPPDLAELRPVPKTAGK
jgi:hypothetical protein